MTFLKFSFDLFIQEVRIIHENASTFFKNECYTLSSSYSSTIFNISTTINTPTTMNTQFEALNAQILIFTPPISFHMHKNYISFNSSLYSSKPSPPPPKDFDSKLCKVHRPFKLMILDHQRVSRFRGEVLFS